MFILAVFFPNFKILSSYKSKRAKYDWFPRCFNTGMYRVFQISRIYVHSFIYIISVSPSFQEQPPSQPKKKNRSSPLWSGLWAMRGSVCSFLKNALFLSGSINLENTGDWQQLPKARARTKSPRKACFTIGSSSWLCEPFPIYPQAYSTGKFLRIIWANIILHVVNSGLLFIYIHFCLGAQLAVKCSKVLLLIFWLLLFDLVIVDSYMPIFIQDSWILDRQLDLISNRSILWTDYGLRSLSKTRW